MLTAHELRMPVLDKDFVINSELPSRQLEALAQRLDNPAHATMVRGAAAHVYHEMVDLEIEPLMATMVAEPELHFHGLGVAPDIGYTAVRKHYEDSLSWRSGGVMWDVARLLVDDDSLYLDGLLVCSVSFARAMFKVDVETDRNAVFAMNTAVMMPFEDGKIILELQFWDGMPSIKDIVYLD